MLFQRLYNWIKYKTLPSSFLFKNRLFIERDSKHRRVMSNFGLSFRNSKWSSYIISNIKAKFKAFFYKLFTWTLSAIIVFVVLGKYYNWYEYHYAVNYLQCMYWTYSEAFDQYMINLFWGWGITISVVLNALYSYLFSNNVFGHRLLKKFLDTELMVALKEAGDAKKKDVFISKEDLNRTIYSWVSNPDSKTSKIVEELFEQSSRDKRWKNYGSFFKNLYKSNLLIDLTSNKQTAESMKNLLSTIELVFNGKDSSKEDNKLVAWCFFNQLSKQEKENISKLFPAQLIYFFHEWSLHIFGTELKKYSFLTKTKVGQFFFDELTYQKYVYLTNNFKELYGLDVNMQSQLAIAKWNRWLYRYSILHRKIFKNSHKLTLAKRLLNSGAYDSKLFTKNLWASEHLSKYKNNNSFNSLFILLYNDYFYNQNNTNFNNFNINKLNSIYNLSQYEPSYFWFTKRFYLFNTLPNNFVLLKYQQNDEVLKYLLKSISFKFNAFTLYNLSSSNIIKSPCLNYYTFSYDYNEKRSDLSKFFYTFKFTNETNENLLRDVFYFLNEIDLLKKDYLKSLYWISVDTEDDEKNMVFQSPSFLELFNLTFNKNFFFKIKKNYYNNTYSLVIVSLSSDNIHVENVIYTTKFK